jgi:hypothetical protein
MLYASALFVSAALVWAGVFKTFTRITPDLPVWVYRTVGVLELAVAVAVFFVPVTGALLAAGFIGFLAYRRSTKPESSCGCTSAKRTPIGTRHFARAGLLLLASVVSPPVSVAMAVAVSTLEFAIYCALSPELDRWWLFPLRRLRVQLTHPLAGATTADIPLHATVQQLQRSETFRRVGGLLRSDVVESWDEGDWRILRYTIGYQDGLADAVFAVPRLTDEPERVRVAIVAR